MELIELLKKIRNKIEEIENIEIDTYNYKFLDGVMEPILSSDFDTFHYITRSTFSEVLDIVYDDEEKKQRGMLCYLTAKNLKREEKILLAFEDDFRKQVIKELVDEVETLFSDIYNKIDSLKRQIDRQQKRNKKMICNYIEIMGILENADNNRIIDFNKIEGYIIDESLKYNILIYVLKHNAEINKKISEKNKILLSDNRKSLKSIFTNYSYNYAKFTDAQIEQILSVPGSIIEKKFELLSQMNIYVENEELLTTILFYVKLENMETILSIIQKYNINSNFIKDNIAILFDEDNIKIKPLYNIFINNINYLKNKGLGIHNLNNNLKFLLMDFEVLSNNVEMLENYNFDLKRITNFELLMNDSLFDIIDSYIEHGLHEYILENQGIIKNDPNVIIRLVINEYLGMPIFNDNNRIKTSITSGKGFEFDICAMKNLIINDVDMYLSENKETLYNSRRNLINKDILDLEIIKDIYKFQSGPKILKFGEQLISMNKVFRNFTCLYEKNQNGDYEQYLFDSIIYNSIMDSITIEKIKSELKKSKVLKKS